MSLALTVAAVGVLCASAASYLTPRQVHPAAAARLTTILAVTAAGGFMWILLLVAGGGLTQVHGIAERLTWCDIFVAGHRETLAPAATVACAALAFAAGSMLVVRRRQRRLRADDRGDALRVVPSDEIAAFSLPGRPGQIVVTTGMLTALTVEERRVLLAHEHAHLRLRHHRYVRATQLAAASLPMLRPTLAKVRFATERWADEEAALAVGSRALVARTIARAAALGTPTDERLLALAGSDVHKRVQALLSEAPRRSEFAAPLLGVVAAGSAAAIGASIVFVHPGIAAVLGYC